MDPGASNQARCLGAVMGESTDIRCVAVCHASKCRRRGAEDLAAQLDKEIVAHGLEGTVATRRGRCNGLCSRGPTMAVRPEGCVYARLNAETIPRIVREHLAGGRPVRALIPKDKGSTPSGKKAKQQFKAARKAEKHARKAAKKAKKRLAAGLMERAA